MKLTTLVVIIIVIVAGFYIFRQIKTQSKKKIIANFSGAKEKVVDAVNQAVAL